MKIDKSRRIMFFVSLIGIFVVTLIMGTTFAYQTIVVDYKEDSDNDLVIEAGKLNVSYENTNHINLTNMTFLPDYKTADYTEFTIKTNDTSDDIAYQINLNDIKYGYINSEGEKNPGCRDATNDTQAACIVDENFKYTITQIEGNYEYIIGEGDFSSLSGTEFYLSYNNFSYRLLEKGKNETLRLYLWLKDTTNDQSNLEKTYFEAKIEILSVYASEINPYLEDTLAYNIYQNGAQVLNTTTNELSIDKTYEEKLEITKVSDGTDMTDVGIFTAPDDYGKSYYFRGPVQNNYVDFAGFTWRIVRINGDGSIRLILNGLLNTVNIPGTETKVHLSGTAFNSSYDKNAYVGYMYGTPGSETYQEEHEFTGDKTTYIPGVETTGHSTIKVALDKFYDTYLKTYEGYMADTLFCGDKTLADKDGTDDNIGKVETQSGTVKNKTYYAAAERLWYSSGTTSITTAKPTLICANNADEDYSRYSVGEQTLKSKTPNGDYKTTNGDLTYPIALLSADELVMAGAFKSKLNFNYYLYNKDTIGTSNWWTMSPYYFSGSYASEFISDSSYSLYGNRVNSNNGVRPVINLKADVLVDSGDGTSGSGAYKVRLASE